MSRKFLDDHIEERVSTPPSSTAIETAYEPGHMRLNYIDGTRYVNEGARQANIFGSFPANRYELIERFTQAPLLNAAIAVGANLNFEVLGTNMTSALSTFATTGGGITLTTAGASADSSILLAHLTTKQSNWNSTGWGTSERIVFETVIKTGASVALTSIWAGFKLTNTPVVATDNDQVFARYDAATASGVWQLITSATNVDTTVNTGITVAASTKYHIKIVVDGNRIARLYINGTLAATSSAALTASVALKPYIGVLANTGAAKAITIRGLRCSKDHT